MWFFHKILILKANQSGNLGGEIEEKKRANIMSETDKKCHFPLGTKKKLDIGDIL
jgi:hypothetical protein